MSVLRNRLLIEDKSYDRTLLAAHRDQLLPMLNDKQHHIFSLITDACFSNMQELVFVYGHGVNYRISIRKECPFLRNGCWTSGTETLVFSTWMAFGGNTRDLGSVGEETDEITDLHQILKEILLTGRGDDVAIIKRHRRDPSSDGVINLVTASGRG
ncbi:hypothetical protein Tco_1213832 [Tanacetum coccineum]